jgi:hypothetical protein
MDEDRVEQQTLNDKPRRLSITTRSSATWRSYA